MAIFKDSEGNKINIKTSSKALSKCQDTLDEDKDKEKGWWQLKDTAVSEGVVACIDELTKDIQSMIDGIGDETSSNSSAVSSWSDDPLHGPYMIAALEARNATIKAQKEVLSGLLLYLNLSKPNTMYFKDDDN